MAVTWSPLSPLSSATNRDLGTSFHLCCCLYSSAVSEPLCSDNGEVQNNMNLLKVWPPPCKQKTTEYQSLLDDLCPHCSQAWRAHTCVVVVSRNITEYWHVWLKVLKKSFLKGVSHILVGFGTNNSSEADTLLRYCGISTILLLVSWSRVGVRGLQAAVLGEEAWCHSRSVSASSQLGRSSSNMSTFKNSLFSVKFSIKICSFSTRCDSAFRKQTLLWISNFPFSQSLYLEPDAPAGCWRASCSQMWLCERLSSLPQCVCSFLFMVLSSHLQLVTHLPVALGLL